MGQGGEGYRGHRRLTAARDTAIRGTERAIAPDPQSPLSGICVVERGT
jgi:hypothetical protein